MASKDSEKRVGSDGVPSLCALAREQLRDQLDRIDSCEPLALEGTDPEGVHGMRVATRRIRAALPLLLLSMKRAGHLDAELDWLASALGEVRDLDVQIARLEGGGPEGSPDLAATFTRSRAAARERLLAVLSAPTYGVPLTTSQAPRSSPVITEPPAPGRSPVTAVAGISALVLIRASCASLSGVSQKLLY